MSLLLDPPSFPLLWWSSFCGRLRGDLESESDEEEEKDESEDESIQIISGLPLFLPLAWSSFGEATSADIM